jgi:hypothetical protein
LVLTVATIPKKPTKMKAKALKTAKGDPRHGEPKPKVPTAPYNVFLKQELIRVKKANPSMPHKEAFKTAAANWAALKNPAAAK